MRWREDGGCPRDSRRRKVSPLLLSNIIIEFKTPAKTKTFSAEEALQEMNEDEQEEIRVRKAQLAQEQ